ncbi:MAG: zinc-ribbon domain-containing protein [Planctomycetota bacterium]
MRCPECASDNPDGSKFCSSCGMPIPTSASSPPPVSEGEEGGDDGLPYGEGAPADSEAPLAFAEAPPAATEAPPVEGEPPGEPTPPPMTDGNAFPYPDVDTGRPRVEDTTFCSLCRGAFQAKELEKVDGEHLCSLCRSKMEGRKSKTPAFGDTGLGTPLTPAAGTPISTRQQTSSEPMSTVKVGLFIFAGLILVGLAGAAVFFFISGDKETPSPTRPPIRDPNPNPPTPPDKGEAVEKKTESPPPTEPQEKRSYEPKWFTGVYKKKNERVLIAAPQDLHGFYSLGKRYKFRFKPSDPYYEKGLISYYDLLSPIEEQN